MAKRWGTLAVACVLAASTAALAHSAAAASAHRLVGSQLVWARSANRVGAVPAATGIVFRVRLHTHDDAGLAAFATAVSTPGSPDRGHYLTPAALRARFGPGDDAVAVSIA